MWAVEGWDTWTASGMKMWFELKVFIRGADEGKMETQEERNKVSELTQ